MNPAHEQPAAPRVAEADVHRVRAVLRDAACWWSTKGAREALPIERLWVCFSCAACGATYDRVFRYPEPARGEPPAHRDRADVERALQDALVGRPRGVEGAEWKSATDCECRAPAHHRSVAGVALFRPMPGSGASLVAARLDGPTEWLRLPDGSGSLEPFDSFEVAFGRPFTLFDAWAELVEKLPVDASSVAGRGPETGVWLFVAASRSTLDLGIGQKLEDRAMLVARLDPALVEGRWPEAVRALPLSVEAGHAAALVVEKEVLLGQVRAWARSRLSGDVTVRDGVWVLLGENGQWILSPPRIALTMLRDGRSLAEACAQELAEAARDIEDRVATLRALTEVVPGSSFDVEGSLATARLADGRLGRKVELAEIPAGAHTLSPELLAREAAFLFEIAPPWADRARVCPCGAACSVEARLVAWPWSGDPQREPHVLRVLGDPAGPSAAEVVALCCDRHVRLPSARELAGLGLDAAAIAARLGADVSRTRPRVHASIWRGDGERCVVAVRGPFASSVVLSDGRARSLLDALGAPLSGPRVAGWAIGSDLAAFISEHDDAATVTFALAEIGISCLEPFWLRREIDLSAESIGSFDVVVDRR